MSNFVLQIQKIPFLSDYTVHSHAKTKEPNIRKHAYLMLYTSQLILSFVSSGYCLCGVLYCSPKSMCVLSEFSSFLPWFPPTDPNNDPLFKGMRQNWLIIEYGCDRAHLPLAIIITPHQIYSHESLPLDSGYKWKKVFPFVLLENYTGK